MHSGRPYNPIRIRRSRWVKKNTLKSHIMRKEALNRTMLDDQDASFWKAFWKREVRCSPSMMKAAGSPGGCLGSGL